MFAIRELARRAGDEAATSNVSCIHVGGLPDFSALRFTRYNQFESLILPTVKYLEGPRRAVPLRTPKVENVDVCDRWRANGPERERTGVGQDAIQKIQATSGFFKRNPYGTNTKKLAVRVDVDHEGDKSSIDSAAERSGVHHQRRLRGELVTDRARQHAPAAVEHRDLEAR